MRTSVALAWYARAVTKGGGTVDVPMPFVIHPHNPKCFEFRGRPLAFVTATEHYGAVMNRPFRFEKYLADAAEKGMTLTRLFCLCPRASEHGEPVQHVQTGVRPTTSRRSTRTGPGRALDGEPKYDLDQWNPEFFERLHQFLSRASDYGIVVEVVAAQQYAMSRAFGN